MKPATIDLDIYKGSTFRNSFQWCTIVEGASMPVDISDCQIRMAIARSKRATEPYIFLTTENNGIQPIPDEIGSFHVVISANDTASLDFSKALYDIEVIFSNGDVFRIVEGEVCAYGEVTRWH